MCGTTGYDFLNAANGAFIEPQGFRTSFGIFRWRCWPVIEQLDARRVRRPSRDPGTIGIVPISSRVVVGGCGGPAAKRRPKKILLPRLLPLDHTES